MVKINLDYRSLTWIANLSVEKDCELSGIYFHRLNLVVVTVLEKISNRKMALQIERNRENKEQLISFVFGFNLPVTIFDTLHYNKWFKTNYNKL
jgi:hypothetical protein